MTVRQLGFFICAGLLLALPAQAPAGDTLVLNTGVRAPYTQPDRSGFLDRLVAEVFRRIGVKAEVHVYEASERAMQNANSGIDDGIAMRIKGLEAQYPNLIRVPEKVIDNDFVAYSRKHDFPTRDWNALAPYHVAHIIGWKVFENRLGERKDVTRVRDAEQLFELLRQDRSDVVLYERWQGLWWARETGLEARVLEPPLASQEMFIYLNRKHAGLVEPAASALSSMKKDGTYKRIFNDTLTPLAGKR
ncbi:MAG: transporter substrate-binding domain-containing protein [Rhodocyclales bacterium]|nr:transporter substrate-binding domain-containing protein [Rhodocyclales bacterium]